MSSTPSSSVVAKSHAGSISSIAGGSTVKPVGGTGSSRFSSCRPSKPCGYQASGSGGGAGTSSSSGVSAGGGSGFAASTLERSAVKLPQADHLGRVPLTPVTPVSSHITPLRCPGAPWSVCAFQHIGDRKTQEDRHCVVPVLDSDGRSPCSFFGVFDGTVGDFASENVKELVIPKLLELPSWRSFRSAGPHRQSDQERLLEQVVRDMYRTVDEALLFRCSKSQQHYATCTSVTALMVGDLLVVGHLGDSRIVLGKEQVDPVTGSSVLVGEQLTMDHKPDQDTERARIEQCGGMVERLQNHSNKPFIRGGDFLMRKALGEQPMQLQYSRAFGAKDLKIFGLSNIPDVRAIRMGRDPAYRRVRFLILASDGLWDVLSSQSAVQIAHEATVQDLNPAEELIRTALLEQSRRKARADNVTAVVVIFDQARMPGSGRLSDFGG